MTFLAGWAVFEVALVDAVANDEVDLPALEAAEPAGVLEPGPLLVHDANVALPEKTWSGFRIRSDRLPADPQLDVLALTVLKKLSPPLSR